MDLDDQETPAETNRVELVGVVAALSEQREAHSGREMTSILVLVTRRWTSRNGKPRESTDTIAVTAYGIPDIPPVGSPVRVVARLHGRSFQGRDGATKHVVDVVANRITGPAPATSLTDRPATCT